MAFCPNCGTQIADGAACPKCAGAAPSVGATTAGGGLTDNMAGALAYVTFIPAIVFLVLEPYNKNRFIRFHAFQCLFLTGALFAVGIALAIVAMIPFIGLLTIPLHFVIWIGSIVLAVIMALKAYQGQKYKLPVIGDMAEKQANTV
ncbi:MAG: DUF4870 domain-containing protein [Acidobacteriia bacterium]|nr:DUF4870 domain-containing protein [Terriglobia bacterium]